MDQTPINRNNGAPPSGRLPASGRPEFGRGSASALSMKWSALHDAARAVSQIAGLAPETMAAGVRDFPATMRDAGGWRRELAEQGIEDISAFMEPGLSALLAVMARGGGPQPAALALWREFTGARDALLKLTPPDRGLGPFRHT